MAGTHSRCRYASPFRVIPCLGQRSENVVQSVSKDRCDVFQDDVAGLHQANGSDEFIEETRAGALFDAGLLTCLADVLAGEAANNNVS